MNTSGEVADLMVKEGIQITEATVKLAAVGAKELTALLLALLNDNKKLQGKTNLKNLLKSEKPLCILQIKEKDLSKFSAEAKKYGVLFSAVTDKSKKNVYCDVIAKQEDVAKLNYILRDRMNYAVPEAEPEPEKETNETDTKDIPENEQSDRENVKDKNMENTEKGNNPKNGKSRAKKSPSENGSKKHGDLTDEGNRSKPSVRAKIEEIKEQNETDKKSKTKEPVKSPEFSQQRYNGKKRKKTEKGKTI